MTAPRAPESAYKPAQPRRAAVGGRTAYWCSCGATIDVRWVGDLGEPKLAAAFRSVHVAMGHPPTDAGGAARARLRAERLAAKGATA